MTGHKSEIDFSELWKKLDWKKFRRNLFRLQRRLFKAVRVGDKRKINSLQRLILRSRSARFLAIRQITQLNQGKKTAGVDGIAKLNFEQRFELEALLRFTAHRWKHQGLKEFPIPKKDGSIRMLKVPTISDRCWQKLIHYVLDAAHEATFAANSFGFRPGRSAHDAQKLIFNQLSSSKNGASKTILEMDVAKCFDNIRHDKLMKAIMLPSAYKQGVYGCLKAGTNVGYYEDNMRGHNGIGTPQGGIISPTLANIALNELDWHPMFNKDPRIQQVRLIRYADDMIAIIKPGIQVSEVRSVIEQELEKWGLTLKKAKTKIGRPTDGFDFLGWKFYVQPNNGKFRSVPSKDNFRKFVKKVKGIVNNSKFRTVDKVKKVAAVVRGWRNYHKFCNMDKHSLWHLNHATWKKFRRDKNSSTEKANDLTKKAFPTVAWKGNGHVKVQGTRSPYDGDIVYWSERNSKTYDGLTAELLRKQKHECLSCHQRFLTDEKVHLHHIDGNHNNWGRSNLQVVHESCHDYLHMGKRETKRSTAPEQSHSSDSTSDDKKPVRENYRKNSDAYQDVQDSPT